MEVLGIEVWQSIDVLKFGSISGSISNSSSLEAFVIPKECRKLVISSAANKWRDFKSKLTKKYIIPFIDTPELLENPPDDYRCINKEHWEQFVAERISDAFQELREAQIEKRKENKYPHRMARKGNANLQEELSATIPIEELDRATMWVKARQDKNGNFKAVEVQETANKIQKLKQKESDGSITTQGSDDVLTLALGRPEHPVGNEVKYGLHSQ
ncbi:uncharacterized protein LOC112184434 [Rosa chinensis]|uniref:uncharacterized protein LOC112184434 n=1 Tax=Rosa chinensis TaxID=74649 RepID=UPI001AD905BF|nr:uncharacterized protein LOC112184434 [Rosa chinensis]